MVGMELVQDRVAKVPDKPLTGRLQRAALERGVILLSAGTYGNIVRVLAPLTTSDEILEEGLDAVEQALDQISAEIKPA
jgi:4-aminobutyrate aminotransferase/(S)-3-amino-2-methylpropionate transaminase